MSWPLGAIIESHILKLVYFSLSLSAIDHFSVDLCNYSLFFIGSSSWLCVLSGQTGASRGDSGAAASCRGEPTSAKTHRCPSCIEPHHHRSQRQDNLVRLLKIVKNVGTFDAD